MKTAIKTATSPISGAKIPLGAHPGNTGGKPGRSGRPPDEFKRFLESIRDSDKFHQRLQALADMSDPQLFIKFAQWLVERTDGKPLQEIQNTGDVTIRVVYD